MMTAEGDEKQELIVSDGETDSPESSGRGSNPPPVRPRELLSPRSRSVDGASELEVEENGLEHRSVSGYIQPASSSDHVQTLSEPAPEDSALNASMNNVLSGDDSPVRAFPPRASSSSTGSSSGQISGQELIVRVDRPEKILAPMDTYILFRISTKATRSDFPESEYSVRRRYSDFAWLRGSLEAAFPLAFYPPLPGKHSVYALDRFDPEFVRARCLLLHFFLVSLAANSKASRTPEFRAFLTANETDWPVFRKKKDAGRSRLTETFNGLAVSTRLMSAQDPRFDQLHDAVGEISQTMTALEKMAGKWQKSEESAAQAAAAVKGVLDHWAETEQSYRLKKSVAAFAAALDAAATARLSETENHEATLTLPLRYWALAADATKVVLKRRDHIQWELESAQDAARKRDVERKALDKAERRDDAKISRAQILLEEARAKSRQWSSELELGNGWLESEWEGWRQGRVSALASLLRANAAQAAARHRKAAEAWEAAVAAIDAAAPQGSCTP